MDSLWPRIGFRRHLTTAVIPGEATYLVSEQGVTAIEGDAVAAIAPLLDGSRDLPALVRDTQGLLSPTELGSLLGKLTQANLVTGYAAPQTESTDQDASAYWEAAGLEATLAGRALTEGRVRLLDLGDVGGPTARDAFFTAGVALSGPGGCDLTVVLCDDYLLPQLHDIDKEQRRSGHPWLLAKPHGVEPWIGPVFQPGEGACWSCMAYRLKHHRQPEQLVGQALGMSSPPTPPRATIAASRSLALQAIAVEAAKWVAGYRDKSQLTIRVLDTLQLAVRAHPVGRRPQCPECGDPRLVGDRVQQPITLASRPKKTFSGNGHRALTAEQVMERYEHLVGTVTGVVSSLHRAPGGPDFLNAYRSGPNPAWTARSLAAFRSGLRSQSGGKGVTALDAKVGALCEGVERYSATMHGDEPRIRASFKELAGEAIHPNECQLYHERQYTDRLQWNAVQPPFQYICDPFDEKAAVDWTPVWSVTHGRHRMVPTGMLYFAPPPAKGPCFTVADSNGNAAGSSLEDAILQGFFELVERDSVALWWYNRTSQPAVDLDSFPDPWIDGMRAEYSLLKREFWVLDLTSDLGIPSMAAISRRTDKPEEDIMFGFGCHFDPDIALRRALTEMNQLLPAVLEAPAEDDFALLDWCTRRTLANQPYLGPDPTVPAKRRTEYGYTLRPDLLDDVHAAEQLVRAHGMELLVLDQTRPDLELPAVKVLVPGLRHFWTRFGPGRLYDVPVRLGRRTTPIPYEELNPIPLFV
ncbi:TOMM precursor leader peptide-binding protein [Streptomyces sp. NBC_01210]|uniref:TOMM precursor leader peptide-binding protein n=1 Tax=Streptomyces sp. NBC_01210 TaxID=2903774 RepID=UPI002E0D19F9|nr:TOMM precursor leader peptide-binding protein [Streptomyces sp. NBC_01210]